MSEAHELSITVELANQRIGSQEPLLLLDCRNPDEYALVHLPDSVLIPMDELPQRITEIESHRDQEILVYCHMGVRSEMVARWLRDQGFSKAQTMIGGIEAWAVQIDNSLPRY